eukprot:CAMPEP_0174716752 /NCGR_PEP_ID=MMETSP1094-20130205/24637_1 /TAXON_ID=156173 /ORGANISM="Chrysochromulina brevifilum, Strain UTEX LB 985" /LENGTH=48 /DNA_ID= /DNA_START= /DNA_END= /DNA_ORIENTATION=
MSAAARAIIWPTATAHARGPRIRRPETPPDADQIRQAEANCACPACRS